ncbi:universal stress protein [Streptomyces sp. NPDC051940]|uniref:universal stress protein n=1 Tax=Streptomyces sp. NPDC051940 TaxID=3155675 RepID=UPI0034468509
MELPIVVGVDGSGSALRAVDWAADEAALHGRPVRLVHASLWDRYEGLAPAFGIARPVERLLAEQTLTEARERARLRRPEVDASTEVAPAAPADALVAAGDKAYTLVVGSHGQGGLVGALLGSASLSVAARAHCPVVVVRGEVTARRRRILCGVGDRGADSAALRFAFREAEAAGCPLQAVRCWRCPAREEIGDLMLATGAAEGHDARAREFLAGALDECRRRHPGVRVQQLAAEGPARRVLLEAAVSADLVVLGDARGTGARSTLRLGPVVHALLHRAPCPVAVVPERPAG